MNTTSRLNLIEKTVLTYAPPLPGLVLRAFQGPADYPQMVAVVNGSNEADKIERIETVEEITNTYNHLHHCDPFQDMLLAEVEGKVVGYSRVWWELDCDSQFIGLQIGYLLPEWRHKGIGSALLRFNEGRLSEIATHLKESGEIPHNTICHTDAFYDETARDGIALLMQRGYQVARNTYLMRRPNLENIPACPLPPGLEVRPYRPEHLRLIWEASNEAFLDHWSSIPDPWEDFERMQQDLDFDPSLWRVAWEGDQVAGMVLSYIEKDENEKFGYQRGWTENICVRRPWRRRGLARALIALALQALKERGMTEAALGVDSENISGALHLYEYMGFRVMKHSAIYRKTLEV